MWIEDFLVKRARALLGLSCGLVLVILLVGLCEKPLIPYWDGGLEYQRTQTLAGLAQGGLWSKVFESFRDPIQGLLTPQTLISLVVPTLAGNIIFYAAILLLSTYIPLAYGIWRICLNIQRPQWATPIFLLSAVNNFSFDYPHVLDLSMQGAALILVATPLCSEWRRSPELWKGFFWGGLLGLSFWIAPVEGFLASITFLIAELLCSVLWEQKLALRNYTAPGITFMVLALPAIGIAAGKQIEESFTSTITHLGFLAVYPASLSAFYNMDMIFVVAIVIFSGVKVMLPTHKHISEIQDKSTNKLESNIATFYWMLIMGSIVIGIPYSFINVVGIDVWSFMLPLTWISIFSVLEILTLRAASCILFAICWSILLSCQILSDWHEVHYVSNLQKVPNPDWYDRFPLGWAHYQNAEILKATSSTIQEALPNSGHVAICSKDFLLDEFRLEYALNSTRSSFYSVKPTITESQDYDIRYLLGSQVIVVFDQAGDADSGVDAQRIQALRDWLNESLVKKNQASLAHIIVRGNETGLIYFLNQPFTSRDFQELEDFYGKALVQNNR